MPDPKQASIQKHASTHKQASTYKHASTQTRKQASKQANTSMRAYTGDRNVETIHETITNTRYILTRSSLLQLSPLSACLIQTFSIQFHGQSSPNHLIRASTSHPGRSHRTRTKRGPQGVVTRTKRGPLGVFTRTKWAMRLRGGDQYGAVKVPLCASPRMPNTAL